MRYEILNFVPVLKYDEIRNFKLCSCTYLTSTVCFNSNQTTFEVKTEKPKTEKPKTENERYSGLYAMHVLVGQ